VISLSLSFLVFLCILVTSQQVTQTLVGTGRLDFYSAQALSILRGRLDVPSETLGGECFFVPWATDHSTCLGYFGIAPAVARIPVLVFLAALGFLRWADLSAAGLASQSLTGVNETLVVVSWLLAFAVFSVAITRFVSRVMTFFPSGRPKFFNALVGGGGAIALSSPMWILAARPMMYEEAILWATTLVLLISTAGLEFMLTGERRFIFVAGIGAASVGLIRITAIIPALLVLGWMVVGEYRRYRRDLTGRGLTNLTLISLSALMAVAFTALVNLVKFHTVLVPMAYHAQIGSDPARLAMYGAGILNPRVLTTKLNEYFGPGPFLEVLTSRPVTFRSHEIVPMWPATHAILDAGGESSSVPGWLPGLTCLAALGVVALWRFRERLPSSVQQVCALVAVGSLPLLVFPGFATRYIVDLAPALVLAGLVGTVWLTAGRTISVSRFILVSLVLLAIVAQSALDVRAARDFGCTAGGERGTICLAGPIG
jgi:hypothetical protein